MNIFARLAEPSTHAGIGVTATAVATAAVTLGANPTKVGVVAAAVQAVFGFLAMFAPEKAA